MSAGRTISWILLALLAALPGPSLAVSSASVESCAGAAQGALTDAWLQGKVEMALLLNRYLDSFRISTLVKDRRVTLTGDVGTRTDRDLATQIVLGVQGVTSIDNRLEVSPSSHRQNFTRSGDITLTARVESRLILDRSIRAMHIDVSAKDAVVTLRGTVTSNRQRKLALRIARSTPDVKSVHDDLKVVSTR